MRRRVKRWSKPFWLWQNLTVSLHSLRSLIRSLISLISYHLISTLSLSVPSAL